MSGNENGRVFISEQSGVEVKHSSLPFLPFSSNVMLMCVCVSVYQSGESGEKGETGGPSKSGETVISGERSALGESVESGETGEICETGETSECAKQGSTHSLPCRKHSKIADLKNGSRRHKSTGAH